MTVPSSGAQEALPFPAEELPNVIATMEHLAKEARTPEEWVLSAENTARVAATLRALSSPKEGEALQALVRLADEHDAERSDDDRTMCNRCSDHFALRDGCDPTAYCDNCAHQVLEEMVALIRELVGSPGGAPPKGEPPEPTPQAIQAACARNFRRENGALIWLRPTEADDVLRAAYAAQFGPRGKNDARD